MFLRERDMSSEAGGMNTILPLPTIQAKALTSGCSLKTRPYMHAGQPCPTRYSLTTVLADIMTKLKLPMAATILNFPYLSEKIRYSLAGMTEWAERERSIPTSTERASEPG